MCCVAQHARMVYAPLRIRRQRCNRIQWQPQLIFRFWIFGPEIWCSSGTPRDIHLFNTDAHRNYVGYRFDGTPIAVELKNCRAYANRTYGLMDNTGAVTYSYCHLYANNLPTGISTDVT